MGTKICFVIMGFGKKTDYSTGITLDLDKTYKNIIKPAAEQSGYRCVRADELKHSSLIDKSMYGLLLSADLVVADISTYNPNAIYELGVRHAVKPFHTIIIREASGVIPFDLSHTSILPYNHLGDDIGVDEATRIIRELKELISSIEGKCNVDSPFYEFIESVTPPQISEEELSLIIEGLAKENDSLFALVEEATLLKKQEKFEEASEYWRRASEKQPSEVYYIQQQAFCKYKSKQPSEKSALIEANTIIEQLLGGEVANCNDPETLGIAGAINKNLYLCINDLPILEKAIEYYGNGFNIRKDYYNGENYALCLNLKASVIEDEDEKIYCKVLASKVRREIVKILNEILVEETIDERDDKRWIYATLANAYFAIDDIENSNKFESIFRSLCSQQWELDTFDKNKEMLLQYER